MKRIIAASIILGLALGGVALAQAGSDEGQRRSATHADPQPLPGATKDAAAAREALKAALRDQLPSRVSFSAACQNFQCVNKRLKTLKNAVNQAQADINGLYNCMGYQGVSSWGENPTGGTYGYVWRDADTTEYLTTSLDYDSLEFAQIWAMVWLCE